MLDARDICTVYRSGELTDGLYLSICNSAANARTLRRYCGYEITAVR
jgi:hypothetical protein